VASGDLAPRDDARGWPRDVSGPVGGRTVSEETRWRVRAAATPRGFGTQARGSAPKRRRLRPAARRRRDREGNGSRARLTTFWCRLLKPGERDGDGPDSVQVFLGGAKPESSRTGGRWCRRSVLRTGHRGGRGGASGHRSGRRRGRDMSLVRVDVVWIFGRDSASTVARRRPTSSSSAPTSACIVTHWMVAIWVARGGRRAERLRARCVPRSPRFGPSRAAIGPPRAGPQRSAQAGF
jgi:hypothetical protein